MTELTVEQFRKLAGVSQAVMAKAMGVPLRTYEDIAGSKTTYRPIHMRAAVYASITLALDKQNAAIMPLQLADLVRAAARLLDAEEA